MSAERTYLDHNATTPLRPLARAAMLAALELVGNASSVHAEGRRARDVVESARERVAALVGADPAQVVFTSGATEANNWVMRAGWSTILVSGTEHESVLAPARASGARVLELPCCADGIARVEVMAAHVLKEGPPLGRVLLTLQAANSETGVLQPVAEAAAFARAHGVATHTDAVQVAGKLPLSFAALGVDLMSLSAHKLGGPKGVGALIVGDGLNLPALMLGGGQERRRRSGTENVAAIAGFGAAAEACAEALPLLRAGEALRARLERGVRDLTPDAVIIGATAPRLPTTSCIALPGAQAATLLIKLDLAGIAVSAGSACSSGKIGGSHVLAAMGVPRALADAAIRVSLGWSTTAANVEAFLAAWSAINKRAAMGSDPGPRQMHNKPGVPGPGSDPIMAGE